jgi:hypothetical protein
MIHSEQLVLTDTRQVSEVVDAREWACLTQFPDAADAVRDPFGVEWQHLSSVREVYDRETATMVFINWRDARAPLYLRVVAFELLRGDAAIV